MEKKPQAEKTPWVEDATKKWKKMDYTERQYWLAQVADEYKLPRLQFIMMHKAFDFNNIPIEY